LSGGYSGRWSEAANGQTLTGPYRQPAIIDPNIGAIGLQFSDSKNATLTLPDGRQVSITRFQF
jgi:hypothetical protein